VRGVAGRLRLPRGRAHRHGLRHDLPLRGRQRVAPRPGTTVVLDVTGAHPVHPAGGGRLRRASRAAGLRPSDPTVSLRMGVETFVVLCGGRSPLEPCRWRSRRPGAGASGAVGHGGHAVSEGGAQYGSLDHRADPRPDRTPRPGHRRHQRAWPPHRPGAGPQREPRCCLPRETRSAGRSDRGPAPVVPSAALVPLLLDLADLASVRRAAASPRRMGRCTSWSTTPGVMATPQRRTVDGFELQIGTNHLGHFALTGLLWPALVAAQDSAQGARVVTVSSQMARRARSVDLADPRRLHRVATASGTPTPSPSWPTCSSPSRWSDAPAPRGTGVSSWRASRLAATALFRNGRA
jgi:NAD(P)-dependent dehydrogenase (short-subunit alcohol dehydrogenase family)